MNTYSVFNDIFDRVFNLLCQPVSLGLGISVSLLQLVAGLTLLSMLIAVISQLFD